MNNQLQNSPFQSKMSSKDIAEVAEKTHHHVMRDIRDLIEKEAINESSCGLVEYKDGKGEMRPMFILDFHATMTLITGYDAKRRASVIDRWMKLETGAATPLMAGSSSAIDAMAGQLIEMVVPAVIERASKAIVGQLEPAVAGLGKKMDGVYSHFGQYSSISAFYHLCCRQADYSSRIAKDDLYRVYCLYCEASRCTPYAKSTFCGFLYRALPGVGKSTISHSGKRIPALHGIALLNGWGKMIEDIRLEELEKDERELARRRNYYFGVDENGDTEV